MPKATKGLALGTPAPASGQYKLKGPRGGDLGREVTCVEGRRLPPTPMRGGRYSLADRTKHKRDK
jgi:hypothetical protein